MSEKKKRLIRRIVSAAFILGCVGAGFLIYRIFWEPLPEPDRPGDIIYTEQGWDDESRRWYYSASQGTLVIPYDWFIALEQPTSRKSLIDPEYFTRFRLIPNPDPQFNPDLLPLGVTKATHPVTGNHWVSFTCAMCHTGQLNYRGTAVRIDGAPSQQDFDWFTQEMIKSLALTTYIPTRFHRFAKRVLKDDYTAGAAKKLWSNMREFIKSNGTRALQQKIERIYPTTSGFGRVDALGVGANGMMYQLSKENELVSDAPVSNPPLWWTHDYDWVQSVAAIEQPLGRNTVEAMGVNAYVDLTGGAGNIAPIGYQQVPGSKPDELYLSSVELKYMFLMEEMLKALEPPAWPERIFGPVDKKLAERGRYLYEEAVFDKALTPEEEQIEMVPLQSPENTRGLCARCHAPQLAEPNEWNKAYIHLKMYKLDVIGTSPADAQNFAARKVKLVNGIMAEKLGKDEIGIGEALGTFAKGVQARRWDELWEKQGYLFFPGDSRDDIPFYQGYRKNDFRAPLAYPARPMGGYWATPPYLHNGSVPNLYELLSPVAERSKTFYLGNLEYDPVKVGLDTGKFRGGFKYDTKIAGNHNTGHEFQNAPQGTPGVIGPYLTPEDRMAIIEYMKIINDFPQDYISEEEHAYRRTAIHWWKEGYSPYDYAPASGEEEGADSGTTGTGASYDG